MLELNTQDLATLTELVNEASGSDEVARQRLLTQLKEAYEKYGTPELVGEQRTGDYIRATFTRLTANLRYAGQKSEDVFMASRDHLKNTLRRLGVPVRDLEPIADAAIYKFYRFQYAESYNPLVASWSHYVYIALSRMVASYWEKRHRDPLYQGFSYQQYEGKALDDAGEDLSLEPYEVDQGPTPEEWAIFREIMQDFERFLSEQEPYRAGVLRKYKEICTLNPSGPKDHKIEEPITAYLVRRGTTQKHRVELFDGTSLLWDIDEITDIRSNSIDSDFLTEKRVERTPLALYKLLMDKGAQVEEIATALHIGNSTAHNWVRQLEEHFREWWQKCPMIPLRVKHMVFPMRLCPGCGWEHTDLPPKSTKRAIKVVYQGQEHWNKAPEIGGTATKNVSAHWCDVCEKWALDNIEEVLELPPPWGQVRGTHDLVERSSKYKTKLTIQRCSM